MIQISDKSNCCGCTACVQRCPKQCIAMQEDVEGFFYPHVDLDSCVNCGLCEKICPQHASLKEHLPIKVLAAINKDEETRKQSSSGGVFSLIADSIIEQGGVVYGVRFDDKWHAVVDSAESREGIESFRGSKYVQAYNNGKYIDCESVLKTGRKVLYTGTPCQISGLKNFLGKEYDNLYTVDIVCHGVPSYKVWEAYLGDLNKSSDDILSINMRDKSRGWKQYSYKILGSDGALFDDYASKSLYLQGFVRNYYLRPSCYSCKMKKGKSLSDITLADFWGIEKLDEAFSDNKGTSAVVVNSTKGQLFIESLDMKGQECSFDSFIKNNPSYSTATSSCRYRVDFWKDFPKYGIHAVENTMKKELFIVNRIVNRLRNIIGK